MSIAEERPDRGAPELVLASSSPYRRELLERLGVPFTSAAPSCDEDAWKSSVSNPHELARLLAHKKAESLRERYPHAHILGGDQLVDLDGEVLGKPGSEEAAIAQLSRMQGRAHRLITAIVLTPPEGPADEVVDVHTLTLRPLSEAEIRRYVAREQPLDCAGSYKIERAGIALVARIEGDDFTSITGIPLIALTSLLRQRGFCVP